MSRFIEEDSRQQACLFPERLDEYIGEDNPVRVIDAFVDGLDIEALEFERAAMIRDQIGELRAVFSLDSKGKGKKGGKQKKTSYPMRKKSKGRR